MADPQSPTNTIPDKQLGAIEAAQEIIGRNSAEEQINPCIAGMKNISHISAVLRTAQKKEVLLCFLDETPAGSIFAAVDVYYAQTSDRPTAPPGHWKSPLPAYKKILALQAVETFIQYDDHQLFEGERYEKK